ncbi:MAG: T9SS type A sorting domain-containing protein [Bacteroidota bacterium]
MRNFVLLLIATVGSFTLMYGQDFLSVNDPIVINNTCVQFQNNAGGNQHTSAWVDQAIVFNDIATPTLIVRDFEIYLGNTGEFSQGLALVIQQEGTTAIGENGGALGYGGTTGGISPSLAFEIDTEHQAHDNAGGSDHLALHDNAGFNQAALAGGPVILPDMMDNSFHQLTLRINWDPTTPANQYVEVELDGTYRITYNTELANYFDLSLPVYIGGTSAPVGTNPNYARASQGIPGSVGTCSSFSLPVEFLDFEAQFQSPNKVKLDWSTASEVNSDFFEVERTQDLTLWQKVGKVQSAGNSSTLKSYSFKDPVSFNGRYYYRLKQVDLDGAYSYSETVSIDVETLPMEVYPNPASDMLYVSTQYLSDSYNKLRLDILDMQGKVYQRLSVSPSADKAVEIPISELRPGIYTVRLSGGVNEVWTKRFMVN